MFQSVIGRDKTPSALALSDQRLYIAFPETRVVTGHELERGSSFRTHGFTGSPRGLAVNERLLSLSRGLQGSSEYFLSRSVSWLTPRQPECWNWSWTASTAR